MKKTTLRIVAVVLATASQMSLAAPTEPYTLYQEHCAKCHGTSGAADNWRGYMYFARSFRDKQWQNKHTDADILADINKGPRIMPSFEKTLSEEQKNALIRVIRGFGR
jgi:mono/diheme cytochrome c family protein